MHIKCCLDACGLCTVCVYVNSLHCVQFVCMCTGDSVYIVQSVHMCMYRLRIVYILCKCVHRLHCVQCTMCRNCCFVVYVVVWFVDVYYSVYQHYARDGCVE